MVAAQEQIEVPLGTFETIRVDQIGEVLPGGITLTGRPTSPPARQDILESHWYALDHGEVQYLLAGGSPFQLSDFRVVLPTPSTSWGALKTRFAPK